MQNKSSDELLALAEAAQSAGDRPQAIEHYQQVLVFFPAQTMPLEYAKIQLQLGDLYRHLAGNEDVELLRQAIANYDAALTYLTPHATPVEYSAAQNNLGMAYATLSEREDSEAYLQQAMTCYETALQYRTPNTANYGMTKVNMGSVYWKWGQVETACAMWREAKACFAQAGDVALEGFIQRLLVNADCGDDATA